jgi:hypothetical protein
MFIPDQDFSIPDPGFRGSKKHRSPNPDLQNLSIQN